MRISDWSSYGCSSDLEGLFNVEYADVLGIPFDFAAKPVVAPPVKPRETVRVHAVRPDRDALEIRFPRVEGYRVELPDEKLRAELGPQIGSASCRERVYQYVEITGVGVPVNKQK